MGDGVGEGGADGDGREDHDQVGELEHRLSEGLDDGEQGAAGFFGEAGEGEPEEDGEDDDLEDFVLGDGLGEVLGKDVEEELVPVGNC